MPGHLIAGIVVAEIEFDPAFAKKPKTRRNILPVAQRKKDAINERISAERQRYPLPPPKKPYYSDPDSIFRAYQRAKRADG